MTSPLLAQQRTVEEYHALILKRTVLCIGGTPQHFRNSSILFGITYVYALCKLCTTLNTTQPLKRR